jgi:hypothetical protein
MSERVSTRPMSIRVFTTAKTFPAGVGIDPFTIGSDSDRPTVPPQEVYDFNKFLQY